MPRIGQDTVEIAFVVVAPRGYNLELYIAVVWKTCPHKCIPSTRDELLTPNIASIYHVGGTACLKRHQTMKIDGDEEPIYGKVRSI